MSSVSHDTEAQALHTSISAIIATTEMQNNQPATSQLEGDWRTAQLFTSRDPETKKIIRAVATGYKNGEKTTIAAQFRFKRNQPNGCILSSSIDDSVNPAQSQAVLDHFRRVAVAVSNLRRNS